MDRDSIKELLKEVIGPNTPLYDHDNWVSMHCPLAPWTHEKGADKTPSAGISVNEDGESIFHCFACLERQKGPLSWFLRQYEKYTGESVGRYIREIEQGEFLGGPLPEWRGARMKKKPLKILDGATYLDLFEPAKNHPYLKKRGINNSTAKDLEICVDPADSQGDERIVFPVYTQHGGLLGFTGRATDDKCELRVRDYYGLPKKSALLGAHLMTSSDTEIIVVEGLFDYAKMVQYGYYAVAAMHAGLTDDQRDILLDIGLPVVLMYDNDDAGRKAEDTATRMLSGRIPIGGVRYPKVNGGKQCVKDPAGLSEEEVDRMISRAQIL